VSSPSIATLIVAFTCGACADAAANLESTSVTAQFDDVFEIVDTVHLEESDTVLNVIPYLSHDPTGGFLVADGRENRVRRYRPSGRLAWQTGGPGDGPGEFRDPRAALRLEDQRVLVAQYNQRITLFDSVGHTVLETFVTPFWRIEDVAVVGRDSILVSAMTEGGFEGSRLHIWRPSRGEIERSWFQPFVNTPVRDAAIIGGFSRVAVRGDTVAATWSLADSVFLFTRSGERLRALPLSSSFFRLPSDEPPSPAADAIERAAWLGSFDYVAGVWWASAEVLAVRYFELLPDEAMARRWHLILLFPGSGRTIDVRNSPRLLSVDDATGTFVFSDPGSEEPNRWLMATLRQ